MKCQVEGCKADTRILSTRDLRRRRECFNGHRFSTVELLAPKKLPPEIRPKPERV